MNALLLFAVIGIAVSAGWFLFGVLRRMSRKR